MKQIRIQLHSFVDVITNSSTVIYCQCNDKAVDSTKEMINEFLKVAGSDKTADDLFTFKLEKEDCYCEEDEKDDCECQSDETIIVTAKSDDKLTIDMSSKFFEIFDVSESYGG